MEQTSHDKNFLIILYLLFLLPLFFIPGGYLNLNSAKLSIITLAVVISTVFYLWKAWGSGEIQLPWHSSILVVFLLPIIYGVSAILTTPSLFSLFGYNFEVGTFGYILVVSILLVLVSILFAESSKLFRALAAFYISISSLAIFVLIKVASGLFLENSLPVWGVFFGNMGNPLGKWTDMAIIFGLLSVFSAVALKALPMKKVLRTFVYIVFMLSLFLISILNFSITFILTLGSSVVLYLYFKFMEERMSPEVVGKNNLPILALGALSILFLANPTIPTIGNSLSDVVSSTFNIANVEVRPSLASTLSVSRSSLSNDVILGSGPNTFSREWSLYRPKDVNNTPFWSINFPFGVGFIPTQVSSTGIAGSMVWAAFFIAILLLGIRVIKNISAGKTNRFIQVSSLVAVLYLWIASLVYTPSFALLAIAFIFSGLFIASARLSTDLNQSDNTDEDKQSSVVTYKIIQLNNSTFSKYLSTFVIAALVLGSIAIGFVVLKNTISSFYLKRAVDISNNENPDLQEIEDSLNKAVKFAPTDIHYIYLAQNNFSKARNVLINLEEGNTEESGALFQNAISQSILMARKAIETNPSNSQNWLILGDIYSSLVAPPLAVSGSYDQALQAYLEARERNPLSPNIPLSIARLEFNNGNIESARRHVNEALALKRDYADAYLLLAQIEIQDNNISQAISSTENLVSLTPNNPSFHFGLGLLKYSSADYEGAAQSFANALILIPDYANARYYLGLSLANLGYREEAKAQLEILLTTNPDNPELKAALEALAE